MVRLHTENLLPKLVVVRVHLVTDFGYSLALAKPNNYLILV